MKTVAFIFARSGSKGLPNKNIKLLAGKTLIAYSIEQALATKRIERVIVSTDSDDIANIALEFGAEVPFLRPSELASDYSPEWLSWRHGLEYLLTSTGSLPKVMVSLPPTSPLRKSQDIDNCLKEFEKNDSDVVVTVTDAHRNPFFNIVKSNLDGSVSLANDMDKVIFRRQDAPKLFDLTTVCYVAKPEFVMNHNSIFEGRVKSVHVPMERSIDIDSLLDFQITEFLKIRELDDPCQQ